MISTRINQETHRNSHHKQYDKDRVMAVDEKETFGICLFIDVMVKLSKVKEEEYDHDDKVENRR